MCLAPPCFVFIISFIGTKKETIAARMFVCVRTRSSQNRNVDIWTIPILGLSPIMFIVVLQGYAWFL